MRVLICPDTFVGALSARDSAEFGALSARDAAEAMADGWHEVAPGDEVTVRPLSDGGTGFLDALDLPGARRIRVTTTDPLGRPVTGEVLVDGATGYVEAAQACGLHLLAAAERDPRITTSYGLGPLVTAAVENGAREVVIGLGGQAAAVGGDTDGVASNDAGAGMLAALDAVPLDHAGYALPYGGAALAACARLGGVPRLRGARLVAATDVDSPLVGLHGTSSVYGPGRGATRADVLVLDAALTRFAEVLERDLPGCPAGLATAPGAGAAGGLGAAVLALGGHRVSGTGLVRRLSGLDAALDAADLVVTGVGSFDHRALRGTVVAAVAEAARDRALPCLVVAGQISAGRREAARIGVTTVYSVAEHVGPPGAAMDRPTEGLRALAARAARQWSR
ncbi:glycerate kinase [Planosporangium sp. 12N6]|uniref:glycerate kinase family protein n=1 Tax=Planosporangium spinosum TaxID=3402278 RepID=UPI003CEAF53F